MNVLKCVKIFDNDGTGTKLEEFDYQLGMSRTIK